MEYGESVPRLLREGNIKEAIRTVENLIGWEPDNELLGLIKHAIQIANGILHSEGPNFNDDVLVWLDYSAKMLVELGVAAQYMKNILKEDSENWVHDVFNWLSDVSHQFRSTILAVNEKLIMLIPPPCEMNEPYRLEPLQPLNFLLSPIVRNDFPEETPPNFDMMFPSM